MMLSGLIEVTISTKVTSQDGSTKPSEKVVILTSGPKYETYMLDQDVHGLKQSLEINPEQDYEHLDPKL